MFDTLLTLDALIYKDALPINKKFPLIIYQQSLGGTIEESSYLFQYLALNGYVVINCAYQPNSGKLLYPDWNLDRSEKDVDFLIRYAKSNFENVDTNTIHLLGFSFGAQSNFNLLTNLKSALK